MGAFLIAVARSDVDVRILTGYLKLQTGYCRSILLKCALHIQTILNCRLAHGLGRQQSRSGRMLSVWPNQSLAGQPRLRDANRSRESSMRRMHLPFGGPERLTAGCPLNPCRSQVRHGNFPGTKAAVHKVYVAA